MSDDDRSGHSPLKPKEQRCVVKETGRTRQTLAEALMRLHGEQLSSVEFVQDYVQLELLMGPP